MNIVLVLAPSFLLLMLGAAMRRWLGFPEAFWQQLERLVYYILFPVLLFLAVARSGPAVLATPGFLATALIFTAVGVALGFAARYLFRLEHRTFASVFQCAFRFSAYIGFALMGGIDGEAGIATFAVLTSVMVPLINAISIVALAHAGSARWVAEIFKNPLVLSTLGGLIFSALGGQIPAILGETLKLLSSAALPMGLLAVGAGFQWVAMRKLKGTVAYFTVVKLVVVPAVAFFVAGMYGLSGVHFNALLVLAALPAAANAYILAVRMGGEGGPVASIVTTQLLVTMVTLPLWLAAAGI